MTTNDAHTHNISLIIPKPPPSIVRLMTLAYYDISSSSYDELDLITAKRRLFKASIDTYIGKFLRTEKNDVKSVLSVGDGTGRRAINIKALSGLSYQLDAVEPCSTMCEVSRMFGVNAAVGHAEEIDELLPNTPTYDSIQFLYSFGHIPCYQWRVAALTGLYNRLRPGGTLFLDVFNIEDVTEWGPEICLLYRSKKLNTHGYDLGDVFCRRVGFHEHAFLHYFTYSEIVSLVESSGFTVENSHYIGYKEDSGHFEVSANQGSIFLVLRKPAI